MDRSVDGYTVGMSLGDQTRSHNEAQEDANKNLEKTLDQHQDLVPCPVCRWVNQEMIRHYRKERVGYAGSTYAKTMLVLCVIGPLVMLPLAAIQQQNMLWQQIVGYIIGTFFVGGLISPVLMRINVYRLRRKIRPNIHWPDEPPVLPPNMPAAMLPVGIDEEGEILYEIYENE